MTTKVTVDAHAGWPVEVVMLRGEPGYEHFGEVKVVQPNTIEDFYIHSGLKIVSISEMPRKD